MNEDLAIVPAGATAADPAQLAKAILRTYSDRFSDDARSHLTAFLKAASREDVLMLAGLSAAALAKKEG